jgi:hypothetical protein
VYKLTYINVYYLIIRRTGNATDLFIGAQIGGIKPKLLKISKPIYLMKPVAHNAASYDHDGYVSFLYLMYQLCTLEFVQFLSCV